MVLHVFTSFLGGVPLCIPYGLYSGTSLGGTTWRTLGGYPGPVLSISTLASSLINSLLLCPFSINYKFELMSCTISGFLNFNVSHLNYEKFNLCLQNTLNMLKTTRVYFGVLHIAVLCFSYHIISFHMSYSSHLFYASCLHKP